jgi:hypothetical protein
MRTPRLLALTLLGMLLTQPAWAAPHHGRSTHRLVRHHALNRSAPVMAYPPLMPYPVTPQFNEPGPQSTPTEPGNPVEQLSPLSFGNLTH